MTHNGLSAINNSKTGAVCNTAVSSLDTVPVSCQSARARSRSANTNPAADNRILLHSWRHGCLQSFVWKVFFFPAWYRDYVTTTYTTVSFRVADRPWQLAFMSQGIYACIYTCKICIGVSQRTTLFGKPVCVWETHNTRKMNSEEMWREEAEWIRLAWEWALCRMLANRVKHSCYLGDRGYLVQLCNCQRLMKDFIRLRAGYLHCTLKVRPHTKRAAEAGSELCPRRVGVRTVLCKDCVIPVKQKAGWRGEPV